MFLVFLCSLYRLGHQADTVQQIKELELLGRVQEARRSCGVPVKRMQVKPLKKKKKKKKKEKIENRHYFRLLEYSLGHGRLRNLSNKWLF